MRGQSVSELLLLNLYLPHIRWLLRYMFSQTSVSLCHFQHCYPHVSPLHLEIYLKTQNQVCKRQGLQRSFCCQSTFGFSCNPVYCTFTAASKLFLLIAEVKIHSIVNRPAPIAMLLLFWETQNECLVMPAARMGTIKLSIYFKMSCGVSQTYKTTNCWLLSMSPFLPLFLITLNGDLTYAAAAVRRVFAETLKTNLTVSRDTIQ